MGSTIDFATAVKNRLFNQHWWIWIHVCFCFSQMAKALAIGVGVVMCVFACLFVCVSISLYINMCQRVWPCVRIHTMCVCVCVFLCVCANKMRCIQCSSGTMLWYVKCINHQLSSISNTFIITWPNFLLCTCSSSKRSDERQRAKGNNRLKVGERRKSCM